MWLKLLLGGEEAKMDGMGLRIKLYLKHSNVKVKKL